MDSLSHRHLIDRCVPSIVQLRSRRRRCVSWHPRCYSRRAQPTHTHAHTHACKHTRIHAHTCAVRDRVASSCSTAMTPFTAALLSTMFLSSITHIHSTNPSINTQYQTTNIPIGSFEISLSIPTTSEDKLLRHDEEFSPRSYTPPKLYITDTVTNKTIWSSPDGSSFLSAAEVDFKVKQNSGYFNFDSHTKHLCQELYITNWTSVDDVTSHSTPMDSYTRSVDPSSGSSSTSAPGRDPVLSASLVTLSGRMCDKQEVEVVFRVFNVSGFAQLSVSMALLGVSRMSIDGNLGRQGPCPVEFSRLFFFLLAPCMVVLPISRFNNLAVCHA